MSARFLKLFCGFLITSFALSTGEASAQSAERDLLRYTNARGKSVTLNKAKDWDKRREDILKNIEKVTGPLPADTWKLPVPKAIFKDTVSNQFFDRYTVALQSYPGEVVPILLYVPKELKHRAPAMIALHGTGAKGKFLADSSAAGPNRATATELAYRGYVVIAPDYPSFGELTDHDFSKDRFESGMMQATFNNIRCIDYLQSRDDVDADNIGVIGHSLGGHTAMFLGAFDQRVKIIVSSCGWTPFEYYNAGQSVTARFGSKLGAWAQDRYMPYVRDKFDASPAKLPFDFDEVIAALAPRYFFSNSPVNDSNFSAEGVKVGEKSARKVYQLLGVSDRLEVHFPDAGHDFPLPVRQLAYQKIDSVLKK